MTLQEPGASTNATSTGRWYPIGHGELAKVIPALGWLPAYQRAWARGDQLAGLTATAAVMPQAMAYATIAGLPVEVGLYRH
jgi:MFS superfamily sulfate permease-like transporter